jgi:choline-glycine betaine transporter
MLAAMLIVLAGEAGLTALQQVITVIGLPMFILVFVMMFALLRGLKQENLSEVKVGPPPKAEQL